MSAVTISLRQWETWSCKKFHATQRTRGQREPADQTLEKKADIETCTSKGKPPHNTCHSSWKKQSEAESCREVLCKRLQLRSSKQCSKRPELLRKAKAKRKKWGRTGMNLFQTRRPVLDLTGASSWSSAWHWGSWSTPVRPYVFWCKKSEAQSSRRQARLHAVERPQRKTLAYMHLK